MYQIVRVGGFMCVWLLFVLQAFPSCVDAQSLLRSECYGEKTKTSLYLLLQSFCLYYFREEVFKLVRLF